FINSADTLVKNIQVNGNGGNDSITDSVNFKSASRPTTLSGGDGNDSLYGGSASESLSGGVGNDMLLGRSGDDTLDGGLGADTLQGDTGNDTADYSKRTENLTLGAGSAADDGAAGEKDNLFVDIETILGGSGNDKITGGGIS